MKGFRDMKKVAEGVKDLDLKKANDVMVSIHEHLEIVADTNIKILEELKFLRERKDKKEIEYPSVGDYHADMEVRRT